MKAGLYDEACARIESGGLVAYPTETVFGLAADAGSHRALERLRSWKGRDGAQPLAVLVESAAMLPALGLRLPPLARRLARELWPGPLTLVVPADPGRFARGVAREEDGAVGVRCSPHPVAAELARRLAERGRSAVTATSLNRSGEAAAVRHAEARALCGGRGAPWLLDVPDAPEPAGTASTVVDVTGPTPVVLREGAVSRARIDAALAGADAP